MNKNERIIWSNLDVDYDEWKEDYDEWLEFNGYDEDDAPMGLYEWVDKTLSIYIQDERANLNKEVDGYIVRLVDVGKWNGRYNGLGIEGTNIRDIL